MPHEPRANYCWSCKYFFPDDDTTPGGAGHCMRNAPNRESYNQATLTGDDLVMFPVVTDPDIVTCGKYVRMEGDIPTIPS
jgi:hypothetical protein